MLHDIDFQRIEEHSRKLAQQQREEELAQKAQLIVSKLKERLEWISSERDAESRAEMVDDAEYFFDRVLEELSRF